MTFRGAFRDGRGEKGILGDRRPPACARWWALAASRRGGDAPECHGFEQHAIVLADERAIEGHRRAVADGDGARGFRAERARPWLQGFLPAIHVPQVHARDVVRAAHAPAVLLLVELQVVERPVRRVRQHRARRAETRGRGGRGTHAPSRAEIGSRATAERSAVGGRPGGTREDARGARVARRRRGRERGPRERGGRHRAEPTERRRDASKDILAFSFLVFCHGRRIMRVALLRVFKPINPLNRYPLRVPIRAWLTPEAPAFGHGQRPLRRG